MTKKNTTTSTSETDKLFQITWESLTGCQFTTSRVLFRKHEIVKLQMLFDEIGIKASFDEVVI